MSDETVLVLGDLIIPVGAGRGISQSLGRIDNGQLRRTVNGILVDTTRSINQKFVSTINATDMSAPTFAELWKGMELVVECISKLRQFVVPAEDIVTLIRPAVEESIFGYKPDGTKIEPIDVNGLVVTFAENIVRLEFRPILTMLVVDITDDSDEYASSESWSIQLEEV